MTAEGFEGHEAALLSLAGEVRLAAAEEYVGADARPLFFVRRLVAGVEHQADLRGATRAAPVHIDVFPVACAPVSGKGF